MDGNSNEESQHRHLIDAAIKAAAPFRLTGRNELTGLVERIPLDCVVNMALRSDAAAVHG